MFDQNGLSLDQAPPIWVVFRFFIAGALFGILGGVSMLVWGDSIFDFSSAGALVLTHIFTLGVMLSFMLGALFQMLPVIAGVTLSNPIKHSNIVQLPLLVGIFSLLYGFAGGSNIAFLMASVLLGVSLLYLCVLMLSRLLKLDNQSASSRGMAYALASLVVVVILGVYMSNVHAGLGDGEWFTVAKKAHYSYGLFGWIALLIISISFQVVEMFYVTPPYPKAVSRWAPLWIIAILDILAIGLIFYPPLVILSEALLFVSLGAYGVLTLVRLSQRKRPLADASMWFWRVGMGSLVASMILLLVLLASDAPYLLDVAVVLFATFSTSIVFAMFYKIVPFLTWFHLNSQGYLMAPMMHEIVHPKVARVNFWIYSAAMTSLLVSIWVGGFIYIAGVLTALSYGWAGYQVIKAGKLYKHTQETSEKFDFGASS